MVSVILSSTRMIPLWSGFWFVAETWVGYWTFKALLIWFGSGFLISTQEKLNLCYLTFQIDLVMGLSLGLSFFTKLD